LVGSFLQGGEDDERGTKRKEIDVSSTHTEEAEGAEEERGVVAGRDAAGHKEESPATKKPKAG
jgi:hypothetical protein